jgi:hypothetical protein
MLAGALLSLSLMACSASNNQLRIIDRNLPGPPSYLQPVGVKAPTLGEDPYDIAARERAGRLQANRIIVKGRTAWLTMKKDFAPKAAANVAH